ncbi:MAG: RNA-binding protein [Promethearchaeota archaeon]
MKNDDSKVFIGKKNTLNYVMAAMVNLSEGRPSLLLARGKTISRAVDVGEIVINTFVKGSSYGKIKIDTEKISNDRDGTISNVSSIEIEILPPKK